MGEVAYLRSLAAVAEADGARLQLFVPGEELIPHAAALEGLAAAGHAVDLLLPADGPALDGDTDHLHAYLLEAREAYLGLWPEGPRGLRVAEMRRNGLHSAPHLQEAIQGLGLSFISSDYSTKVPDNPRNIGFADKNAAMIMKHSQPRWYPAGLLEVPAPGYSDRAFFETQGRSLEEWVTHLQQCVDFAHDMGGLLYAPPLHLDTLATHDPEGASVRLLLEYAASKKWGDVRFCTHREVWEWAEGARAAASRG